MTDQERTTLQWIAALTAVPVTTLEEAVVVIAEIKLEANKALRRLEMAHD